MPEPVVLLDRDGVINRDPGGARYVMSRDDFHFVPRAKEAIALLTRCGFRIYVISNQAGVGRGLFTGSTLQSITGAMLSAVEQAGGRIERVYYCTHKPEDNCSCRKPKPGLFEEIVRSEGVSLSGSFFIGDSIRDVKAAHAAGCKAILVLSGKETLENRDSWDEQPEHVFSDLYQAALFITGKS